MVIGRVVRKRLRDYFGIKNIRTQYKHYNSKDADVVYQKLNKIYKRLKSEFKFDTKAKDNEKTKYYCTVTFESQCIDKDDFALDVKRTEVYTVTNPKDIYKYAAEWKNKIVANWLKYEIKELKVENQKLSITKTESKIGTDPMQIKLKDMYAPMIDAHETHDWDTKSGKCVFDYLMHTYKTVKGIIKLVKSYDTINAIWFDEESDNSLYNGVTDEESNNNPLYNGVTVEQIKMFCIKARLPMYCLDSDDIEIDNYYPEKVNKNIGAVPLSFRIINKHFYPIDNLSNHQLDKRCKINNTYKPKHRKSQVVAKKNYDVKVIECVCPLTKFESIILEQNKIPFPFRNVYFDGQLRHFSIGDTKYILTNSKEETYNQQLVKQYCEINEISYQGQTVFSILTELLSNIVKSKPNPHVQKSLIADGVKHRNHYGAIPNVSISKRAVAADINKCYRHCMESPLERWIVLEHNDVWEKYDNKLSRGLYYVKTNDFTLLHGTNIYSNTILELALKENIRIKIVYQLKPKTTLPKDYLTNILQTIKDKCGNNEKVTKLLINSVSGILAKHKSINYKVMLNNDIEQVFHHMNKYTNAYLTKTESGLHIYGDKFETEYGEHNIAMYIQLTDHSNIMLYEMAKSIGGTLAFRKTDMVVMNDVEIKPITNNKNGGFKLTPLPTNMDCEMDNTRQIEPLVLPEWKTCDENDSDDYLELLLKIKKNEGGLISGRAGTGKTFCAMKIAELWEKEGGKVLKMAFTNKAALNIDGFTIHKFMKHISKTLSKQQNPLIIVDEISMNSAWLWQLLGDFKLQTGFPFLLIGDYRQCSPVEKDGWKNYFNHPTVMYLANYFKCDLTVMKRYDIVLWHSLESVEKLDVTKFPFISTTTKNICFTNKTRKLINAMHNEKIGLFVKAVEKEKDSKNIEELDFTDENYQQDTYVYPGLPVISRKNVTNGQVNSESFIVTEVNDDLIICSNERRTVEITAENFLFFFAMAFCVTTHKCQGDTITDYFTIYDWHIMPRNVKYTALSRATRAKHVCIDTTLKQIKFPKYTGVSKRIQGYKAQDVFKQRETDLTVEFVNSLLKHPYCSHCNKLCADKGTYQWSVDRVDDSLGHVIGNCVLSCLSCNKAHRK